MSEKKPTSRAKSSKEGMTRFPDGMPHSDRLNEILEKAKKKKALTSAEMMELDALDLDNEQSDLFYDIVANLGIDLLTDEDLTVGVEPTDEAVGGDPGRGDCGSQYPGGLLRHRRPGAHVSEGDRQGQPALPLRRRSSWPRESPRGTRPRSQLDEMEAAEEEIPEEVRAELRKGHLPWRALQAAAGRGQSAPGGLHCQAVCGPGHAVPGSDPGGQPGPDQGGGEV